MKEKEIELKNFEDEYMIKVKGGKYIPSFSNELKEVFDIEVCKYLTTQKMWLEVMENNPSGFKGDNRPVETVSWWEVLEYCNRLSEKYGLEPVYDLSKSKQGILAIRELKGKTIAEMYPNSNLYNNFLELSEKILSNQDDVSFSPLSEEEMEYLAAEILKENIYYEEE